MEKVAAFSVDRFRHTVILVAQGAVPHWSTTGWRWQHMLTAQTREINNLEQDFARDRLSFCLPMDEETYRDSRDWDTGGILAQAPMMSRS